MKPSLSIPDGRLRPATADDLEDLLRLLRDEGVRRYLCDDVVVPRDAVAAMLTASDKLESQGLGLWVIEHMREGFAGVVGLQPVSAEAAATPALAGGVEPIIALHPRHWGQGLAGAALAAMVLHARRSLGLSRLVAAVDQPNAHSHWLLQRRGFAAMGRTPGRANELILYELLFGEGGTADYGDMKPGSLGQAARLTQTD